MLLNTLKVAQIDQSEGQESTDQLGMWLLQTSHIATISRHVVIRQYRMPKRGRVRVTVSQRLTASQSAL